MSLEDKVRSGDAPAWRPDQDDPDYIEGEVVDIARGQNDYGAYPIVTIRTAEGEEKAIHGFRTVLRNELLKVKPQIGETIGVLHEGEQPTKPGSKFKSYIGYTVKVDREGGSFNWDSLGGEEDPGDFAEGARKVTVPDDAGEDDIPF